MPASHNHPFKRIVRALKPDERSRQIMLDPVITIAEHEAWLFKNEKAKADIEKGLEELHQGKTEDLGSFAKYTIE